MRSLQTLVGHPLVLRLGWTLLHSLGQEIPVAGLAAGILGLLRRRSATARYLAGCAALGLMTLVPLVTFWRIGDPPVGTGTHEPAGVIALPTGSAAPPSPLTPAADTGPIEPPREISALPSPPPVHPIRTPLPGSADSLQPVLPWLVGTWLGGVALLALRLLGGWVWVQRLGRRDTRPVGDPWGQRLAQLSRRWQIQRPVRLVESALVQVPLTIGWLRPVILLPGSALAGLLPRQLEAILAHELAHIRRHDYLVNLIQSVVETVLFYHPAVWWVSGRIRLEREHCCDDLAVAVCGDRLSYARALAVMEELRSRRTRALAVPATGGRLLGRIRRILNLEDQSMKLSGPCLTALSVLLVGSVLLIGVFAPQVNHADAGQPKPASLSGGPGSSADLVRLALDAAGAIADGELRASALVTIATAQTEAGNRGAGLETLRQALGAIGTVKAPAWTYDPPLPLRIARAQATAGDRAAARQTVQQTLRSVQALVDAFRTVEPRLDRLQAETERLERASKDLYPKVDRDLERQRLAALHQFHHALRESRYSPILQTFGEIMTAQVELADRTAAHETFRQARQFIQTAKCGGFEIYAPDRIVSWQATLGDFDGAFRTIAEAKMPGIKRYRDDLTIGLLEAMAQQAPDRATARRALDRALAIARTVEDPVFRAQDLAGIVRTLAKVGDFDGALEAARSIEENPPDRSIPKHERRDESIDRVKCTKSYTLQRIASDQVAMGDRAGARKTLDEALQIANTVRDQADRNGQIGGVAVTCATAGDFAGALRLAKTLDPASMYVFKCIGHDQMEAGDRAGAREPLQRALQCARAGLQGGPIDPQRSGLLSEMAVAQANLGNVTSALATAEAITDDRIKGWALSAIAMVQARVGDAPSALKWAGNLSSPRLKAQALSGLAEGIAERIASENRSTTAFKRP